MFPLVHQVGSSLRGDRFERLVREVADRSLAPARERLSRRAATMSPAELRGYVRARAIQPVRVHAKTLVVQRRMPDTLHDELVPRALERTIHLLVSEFLVPPVVTMPAPHVRLRVAA